MRYMIIVKATRDSEAGKMPSRDLLAEMGQFHEELAKAGVLRDAFGLKPSTAGWRIEYDGRKTTVVDGPFAETKELIAGYTIIEVSSREEALEWTRRFPNPSIDGGGQARSRSASSSNWTISSRTRPSTASATWTSRLRKPRSEGAP